MASEVDGSDQGSLQPVNASEERDDPALYDQPLTWSDAELEGSENDVNKVSSSLSLTLESLTKLEATFPVEENSNPILSLFLARMHEASRHTSSLTAGQSDKMDFEFRPKHHWLPLVFMQSRPTTAFKTSGDESRCFGEHIPGAVKKLEQSYIELLRVPFETGQVEVRLYLREEDRRARILCRQDVGGRKAICQTITVFRIARKDSCLHLVLLDGHRESLLVWATLRFPTYERLVLFFCCLLALKAQDESDPIRTLDDHMLEGETVPFSAVIIDDNYQHALQIFKDIDSGGIRIQASALKGPLKRQVYYNIFSNLHYLINYKARMPVWTAFINHNITAKTWARLSESRKVHIVDMQRYIFQFDEDYSPQLGPKGEHELYFIESSGKWSSPYYFPVSASNYARRCATIS